MADPYFVNDGSLSARGEVLRLREEQVLEEQYAAWVAQQAAKQARKQRSRLLGTIAAELPELLQAELDGRRNS